MQLLVINGNNNGVGALKYRLSAALNTCVHVDIMQFNNNCIKYVTYGESTGFYFPG